LETLNSKLASNKRFLSESFLDFVDIYGRSGKILLVDGFFYWVFRFAISFLFSFSCSYCSSRKP